MKNNWDKFSKYISIFDNSLSLVGGIIFGLTGVVIGVVFWRLSNSIYGFIAPTLFFGVGAFMIIVTSTIAIRQIKKRLTSPPDFNHFSTGTADEYSTPHPAAITAPNEAILGWFGPVERTDFKGLGRVIIAKELVKSGEDTILATNHQLIFIMLGPNLLNPPEPSLPGKAVQTLMNADGSSISQKKTTVQGIYLKKWPKLIEKIKQKPLQSILNTHLNFAIPYSEIKRTKIRRSFINPGLTIYLKDGSYLRYATFDKSALDTFLPILKKQCVVEE